MNKYLKRFLFFSLLLTFISTVSYCSAPFDTETAQTINVRKTINGEGYILRNETTVSPQSKGAFESGVQDGTRVSRNGSLGITISGNYNEELVEQLKSVTKRIDDIEKANSFSNMYSSDEARIFSGLKDLSATIREDVRNQDFISATENATQLSNLLIKKETTDDRGSTANLLSELKGKKYELEQQLGGIRQEVRSPAAGYFFTSLDGLERTIKETEITAISTSEIYEFDNTLKNNTPDAGSIGKIIDTYAWYLACVLETDKVAPLKAGGTVTLSIDESTGVKATVLAINEDEAGSCAVLLKCTRDISGIFEKRKVDFEICYEEYNGLYVPAAAIRVVDGVTGVYVINRNDAVSFRAVDIILQEEDYYIVRSSFTPPAEVKFSPLRLYDDILVNPEVATRNELKE